MASYLSFASFFLFFSLRELNRHIHTHSVTCYFLFKSPQSWSSSRYRSQNLGDVVPSISFNEIWFERATGVTVHISEEAGAFFFFKG